MEAPKTNAYVIINLLNNMYMIMSKYLTYILTIYVLTDKLPNYPAPKYNCSYQLFDLISDAYVENGELVKTSI